ncbi:hypothetical protein IAT38_002153 [Cryptococcus sp. DSM 104549]
MQLTRHEICNALDILEGWETTRHVPVAWDPTGPYDPSQLSNAPNRLPNIRLLPNTPAPTTITPLFIVAAFHAIDLVEQGFDDEWREIRESYAADRADKLVKRMSVLRMPAWVPVGDDEVAPRRKGRGGEEPRSGGEGGSGAGVIGGLSDRSRQKKEE